MNKFIEATKQFPALCKTPDAERWARVMELIFLDEQNEPSVFAMKDIDVKIPGNRLEQVFAWVDYADDREKAEYCKLLVEAAYMSHEISKHELTTWAHKFNTNMEYLALNEAEYKDVTAIFPLSSITDEFWIG